MSSNDLQTQAHLLEEEYQINRELQKLFSRREILNREWDEFRPIPQDSEVIPRTFHPFPRLPIELRTIIWEHTLSPRIISFQWGDEDEIPHPLGRPRETPRNWSMTFPKISPPIPHVCHESRQVFLRRYITFGTSDDNVPGTNVSLNPTLDTFFFSLPGLQFEQAQATSLVRDIMEGLQKNCSDTDFVSKIRKLALSTNVWGSDTLAWDDEEWNILDLFPRVEEVVFVENDVDECLLDGVRGIEWLTQYCSSHRRNYEGSVYPFHRCSLNTGIRGQGRMFLAPFHEGELWPWERAMSMMGCLRAISQCQKWSTTKVSVARLVEGIELDKKGPLVNFEAVRLGPPNVHLDWLDWKESQSADTDIEEIG